MGHVRELLLAAMTSMLFPLHLFAQDTPIILEAENGTLGAAFGVATVDGAQAISIGTTIGGGNPNTADRTVSFTVTFPAAGTYELYGRVRVGPATFDDDSFYYGNGFGAKSPSADLDWILANGLAGFVGFTLPSDKVVGGGLAQSNVWKWVKLSAFDGGEPPVAGFVVPAGALEQTFQIAGRENGLALDKFAFGRQGLFFTVNALDNGLPGTTEPPPPPFTPTGPPIATGQAKFLGSALSPAQTTSFTAYWNKVTPENDGKWASVESVRDQMNWTGLDRAYQLAKTNNFPFHMHVLVWGNQQPAWIETLPPEEQLAEIHEWFSEVAARYPDIDFVEVVNEPLHDPPNQPGNGGGNYINALGGTGATGWDWVLNAFRIARTYFPDRRLMINDFSITNSPTDTQRYLEIIRLLQPEHLIDAIGVQGHAFSTRPNIPMATHVANLDALAATGLPIYVTEFDIDGPTDEVQLADYQRVFPVFWEHPAVQGITLWGFRPGHWRTAQGAYIVLENGAERPAMLWLQQYVRDNIPAVTAGQTFTVSEAAANGTTVGNVVATDADPNAVLADWRIDGGDGAAVFAIDPATGVLRVSDTAALDFEATTSYTLLVSVGDGFRRSPSASVQVSVGNENDNAPVIAAGQSFRIDGGTRNTIGELEASDADDTNAPDFTTLQGWSIVSGNTGSAFAVDPASGILRVARPGAVDFRKSSYTLGTSVSDGANTALPQAVTITLPQRMNVCLFIIDLRVPKLSVPPLLRLGASLGSCSAH
jgi:endo-1,4-beta-xylanase